RPVGHPPPGDLRDRVGARRLRVCRAERPGGRPYGGDDGGVPGDVHRAGPGDPVRLVAAGVPPVTEARALGTRPETLDEGRVTMTTTSVSYRFASDAASSPHCQRGHASTPQARGR